MKSIHLKDATSSQKDTEPLMICISSASHYNLPPVLHVRKQYEREGNKEGEQVYTHPLPTNLPKRKAHLTLSRAKCAGWRRGLESGVDLIVDQPRRKEVTCGEMTNKRWQSGRMTMRDEIAAEGRLLGSNCLVFPQDAAQKVQERELG